MTQFHADYELTCTTFAHPDITTGVHTNGPCTVWVRYKGGPWLCTHEKAMHLVRKAIDEQGEGYAKELEWMASQKKDPQP